MSKTRDIAILELFERARAALPLRQFLQELRADPPGANVCIGVLRRIRTAGGRRGRRGAIIRA
ncbi:hypothetical protein [Denitratimonas sp. CY0512]|uniref:hypothetical protein n=1 Tax=Denitratimonas sp. CY0512 TaxID=3131940 RepID=UPI0016BAADDF|nr:hypothetical protein [Gammaproteobacteria bacterium]